MQLESIAGKLNNFPVFVHINYNRKEKKIEFFAKEIDYKLLKPILHDLWGKNAEPLPLSARISKACFTRDLKCEIVSSCRS